mmetsp:Transcript_35224/g.87718  ORF Transcript_35224/g.87718 Transcript_35224/m.87718 type:complete len:105 (-) Transcript_35224:4-318(-)
MVKEGVLHQKVAYLLASEEARIGATYDAAALLSSAEAEFLLDFAVAPSSFVVAKRLLLTEAMRVGAVGLSRAQELVKSQLSGKQAAHVYDFLLRVGMLPAVALK